MRIGIDLDVIFDYEGIILDKYNEKYGTNYAKDNLLEKEIWPTFRIKEELFKERAQGLLRAGLFAISPSYPGAVSFLDDLSSAIILDESWSNDLIFFSSRF